MNGLLTARVGSLGFATPHRSGSLIVIKLLNRRYVWQSLSNQLINLLLLHGYALVIVHNQADVCEVVDGLLIFQVFVLVGLAQTNAQLTLAHEQPVQTFELHLATRH